MSNASIVSCEAASRSQATPWRRAVEHALNEAGKSPCKSQRGAAIYGPDIILGFGHNARPVEFPCTSDDACKGTCRRLAVHAEQAALLNSPYTLRMALPNVEMVHVKMENGKLVASGYPDCLECSKLILAANVKTMWLYHEHGWHPYTTKDFHKETVLNTRWP